ncbi:MAG: universal stress protein, partial [Halobacteriales archaeon]|nr:universal stress protein [Halobacteriales archaeon]
ATEFDAELHVLYVVDTSAVAPEAGAAGIIEAFEAAGQRAIDEVTDRAASAGVNHVEGMVGRGVPHRAILEYAKTNGVDLIVMGTHGRTGLDRYLLGSVTEKVVRLAESPVLTVRS